jgi:hypothetical protein
MKSSIHILLTKSILSLLAFSPMAFAIEAPAKNADGSHELNEILSVIQENHYDRNQVKAYLDRFNLIDTEVVIKNAKTKLYLKEFAVETGNYKNILEAIAPNGYEFYIAYLKGFDELDQPVKINGNFSFKGTILGDVWPGPFDDPTIIIKGEIIKEQKDTEEKKEGKSEPNAINKSTSTPEADSESHQQTEYLAKWKAIQENPMKFLAECRPEEKSAAMDFGGMPSTEAEVYAKVSCTMQIENLKICMEKPNANAKSCYIEVIETGGD